MDAYVIGILGGGAGWACSDENEKGHVKIFARQLWWASHIFRMRRPFFVLEELKTAKNRHREVLIPCRTIDIVKECTIISYYINFQKYFGVQIDLHEYQCFGPYWNGLAEQSWGWNEHLGTVHLY